ncbi:MAG: thioesterase family protein [Thermogutta sp.]|nr:thioesterase family protein [Thermogutta sp.]HOP78322.1 thioesterase family protein [Thermogutta sp.]HPU05734.1 thioesterase family protein [Thermogutta sp.]HPZ83922.1 thioesterase family protein [Thermogutta sp.]HQF14046.1 thioesterase family protein [Thermogutta sp.]
MLREHEIEIRVRYPECDPMGLLHHSRVFVYFEMGRTELLRASGGNYRQLEEQGLFVVVVEARCRYYRPARYDDLLRLRTRVTRMSGYKIEHEYHLFRGEELLCRGQVTLAVVDRTGQVRPIPEAWQLEFSKEAGESANLRSEVQSE